MADTNQLVDKFTPAVRKAFVQSIRNITDDVQLERFIALLTRGDIERAVAMLDVSAAHFAPMVEALRTSYIYAGDDLVQSVNNLRLRDASGAVVRARFDGQNPRATQYLLNQSSSKITGDLLPSIRRTIRETLSDGLAAGKPPRTVALDLVGRRTAGVAGRSGGSIGLTDQFRKYADTAYEELRSTSKPMLRNYLSRKTRDKRYDSLVRKALKEGKSVPAEQARKMAARMRDNLLKVRGENIARTELLESVNHAQQEGLDQLIDGAKLEADQITSTWDAAEDGDTRPSHAHMDNQKRAYRQPFKSGDGYLLLYPGDRSQGAPAKETNSCRCVRRIHIDHLKHLGRAPR